MDFKKQIDIIDIIIHNNKDLKIKKIGVFMVYLMLFCFTGVLAVQPLDGTILPVSLWNQLQLRLTEYT